MSLTTSPTEPRVTASDPGAGAGAAAAGDGGAPPGPRPSLPYTPRRIVVAAVAWVIVTLVVAALVVYGVGPMLARRDQSGLLDAYRVEIRHAANATVSQAGAQTPTRAPDPGDPVAILEIGDVEVQQVVVEGVGPPQTRDGPGHVPGTAGPGQPGNSAIVARRSAFGGPFARLADLEPGDRILVVTTQGETTYEVSDVRTAALAPGSEVESANTTTTAPPETTTTAPTDPAAATGTDEAAEPEDEPEPGQLPRGKLTTDDAYGPSEDDRLTLVTSASRWPWATDRAVVVVAVLQGRPFEPTLQGGRTEAQDGRSNDPTVWAPLGLALAAYAVAAVGAVLLYRRARPRSSYLLTAPPLVAATFLMAEAGARALPAWF